MYRKTLRTLRLERKRRWSRRAVAAKARKRFLEALRWNDVGGFVTDGILRKHIVRLLAKDDEDRWLAVSVDGCAKRPRTMRGVIRCLAEMVWSKSR